VALSKCTVRVGAGASKKTPSNEDAAAALELEGAETLGDVAAGLVGNLFVHVQLPALATAGAGAGGESQLRCSSCASRKM